MAESIHPPETRDVWPGALVAFGIGLLSLRVRAIFFSMITLAVASAMLVLASQLSAITGGEDGLSFQLPPQLRPAFRVVAEPMLGVAINGRLIAYYLIVTVTLGAFLLLLRIVNSPFGRVLQAIRENEFRAEALGYRVVAYRVAASVIAVTTSMSDGRLPTCSPSLRSSVAKFSCLAAIGICVRSQTACWTAGSLLASIIWLSAALDVAAATSSTSAPPLIRSMT